MNQRIRLCSGYGYLTYNSGPGPFRGNQAGQSLYRHVLPLILQYRPVRTVLAELNYLLTSHLSLRAVGFYANSMLRGGVSYQARSVSGGLSYRF